MPASPTVGRGTLRVTLARADAPSASAELTQRVMTADNTARRRTLFRCCLASSRRWHIRRPPCHCYPKLLSLCNLVAHVGGFGTRSSRRARDRRPGVASVWRHTLTDERRGALALADLPLRRAQHLPLLPRC